MADSFSLKIVSKFEVAPHSIGNGRFGMVFPAAIANSEAKRHGVRGIIAKKVHINNLEAERSEEDRRRVVLQEIDLHQGLRHPNIAKLIDYQLLYKDPHTRQEHPAGRHEFNVAWLFVERLGFSLVEAMDRNIPVNIADVIDDVTAALAFIHSKDVLHRDVSPGNIMGVYDDQRKRTVFKMIDFGVSRHKLTHEHPITTVAGTRGLQAREYLLVEALPRELSLLHEGNDRALVSTKVDMYSLGATLYYFLVRHVPQDTAASTVHTDLRQSHYHRHTTDGIGVGDGDDGRAGDNNTNSDGMLAVILQSLLQPRPEMRPSAVDTQILAAAYRVLRGDRSAVLRRFGLDPDYSSVKGISLAALRREVAAAVRNAKSQWGKRGVFDVHDLVAGLKKVLSLDVVRPVSVMDFSTLDEKTVLLYPDDTFPDYTVGLFRHRLQEQWNEDDDVCIVVALRHRDELDACLDPAALDSLFTGDTSAPIPRCCFETGTSLRLFVLRNPRFDLHSSFMSRLDGDRLITTEIIGSPQDEYVRTLTKIKDKEAAWAAILDRISSMCRQWSKVTRELHERFEFTEQRIEVLIPNAKRTFESLAELDSNPVPCELYDFCRRQLKQWRNGGEMKPHHYRLLIQGWEREAQGFNTNLRRELLFSAIVKLREGQRLIENDAIVNRNDSDVIADELRTAMLQTSSRPVTTQMQLPTTDYSIIDHCDVPLHPNQEASSTDAVVASIRDMDPAWQFDSSSPRAKSQHTHADTTEATTTAIVEDGDTADMDGDGHGDGELVADAAAIDDDDEQGDAAAAADDDDVRATEVMVRDMESAASADTGSDEDEDLHTATTVDEEQEQKEHAGEDEQGKEGEYDDDDDDDDGGEEEGQADKTPTASTSAPPDDDDFVIVSSENKGEGEAREEEGNEEEEEEKKEGHGGDGDSRLDVVTRWQNATRLNNVLLFQKQQLQAEQEGLKQSMVRVRLEAKEKERQAARTQQRLAAAEQATKDAQKQLEEMKAQVEALTCMTATGGDGTTGTSPSMADVHRQLLELVRAKRAMEAESKTQREQYEKEVIALRKQLAGLKLMQATTIHTLNGAANGTSASAAGNDDDDEKTVSVPL
ncbi:CAMK protein kinase [Salpingoeca rosetta]|uniref:NEK6-subfamily protein kinase n=1 Tax=Salpingoeca rosetta (strain ATCC 50818 / BSB-021) TaxID=946362 RepID=F2ULR1_SALR5|nr:CAMK protein kinase [Salpingoeca rosetta]EGD78060.1 CAMK protein kinase [Salpingoeca rosetta]|eukprot:XP_004989736.1 CAMK protein kinase [Salpingoeca rosetta]